MKPDDPAFPRQTWDYYPSQGKTQAGEQHPGMSLRAYFAAKAMQGFVGGLSTEEGARAVNSLARDYALSHEDVMVRLAVRYADALIAELNK